MFSRVLVANRSVIACRIFRTLRRMGILSVAVYAEADRHSMHVSMADEAMPVSGYLDIESVLEAATRTKADAVHPGYGFLSENAEFAEACEAAGIAFIGPTPDQIRSFGLKHSARRIAQQSKVPLLPGTPLLATAEDARAAAVR